VSRLERFTAILWECCGDYLRTVFPVVNAKASINFKTDPTILSSVSFGVILAIKEATAITEGSTGQ